MATNYWNGSLAQFLLNKIRLKDGVSLEQLAADPTVVAAEANTGSLGIFGTALYQKQDSGSTVNWVDLTSAVVVALQEAYDNSVDGAISLDATRNAFKIKDNSTPLAQELFEVLNDAETIQYFQVSASHTSITDADGTLILREESDLTFIEDFKVNLPSAVYTTTGLSGSMIDDNTATRISGHMSAGLIIGFVGDSGDSATSAAVTGLENTDYQEQEFRIEYRFAGADGVVKLVLEESPDGAAYTTVGEVDLKNTGGEILAAEIPMKLLSGSIDYRHRFESVVDGTPVLLTWDNITTKKSPAPVAECTDIRACRDFSIDSASSVYTTSGTTNNVVDGSLDGDSASFTVVAGDGSGTITGLPITNLTDVDKELLSIDLDWKYGGVARDIQLTIEESSDGVAYNVHNAPFGLPSGNTRNVQLNFKLQASTTHYREVFTIVNETVGAIAEWVNVKVEKDPDTVISSSQINSVGLEGNGGESITANTENVVFNGTGNGWNSSTYEYEVQSSDTIVNIFAQVTDTGAADRVTNLYKNGVKHKVLMGSRSTFLARTKGGGYISSAGEFSAGDLLSIRVDSGITLLNDPVEHYLNIKEEKASSNVVFQGQTSQLDTQPFSPVIEGFGTPTITQAVWARSGNRVKGYVRGASGTVQAVEFRMYLPNGYTVTNSFTSTQRVGDFDPFRVGTDEYIMIGTAGDDYLNVSYRSAGNAATGTPFNGNVISNSSNDFFITFDVPVNELKASDITYSVPATGIEPTVETKLTSDITSTGVVADFTRSDLIIGRRYKVEGVFDHTLTASGAIYAQFLNGANVVAPFKNDDNGISSGRDYALPVSFSFVATDPNFTFNITGISNATLKGNNTTEESFLQLTELNKDGYFLGNMPSNVYSPSETTHNTTDTWGGKRVEAISGEFTSNISTNTLMATILSGLNVIDMRAIVTNSVGTVVNMNSSVGGSAQGWLEYANTSGEVRAHMSGIGTVTNVKWTIWYID